MAGNGEGARMRTSRLGELGALVEERGWELGCQCLRGAPSCCLDWQPPIQTTKLYRAQERDMSTLAQR